MICSRLTQAPRGTQRAACTAVALALAPLLAACSGGPGQTAALSTPVLVTPTPAATAVTSSPAPSAQVVAALTGYTSALGKADRSRSAATARVLLRPFVVPDRIDGLVQLMSSIWAKGEVFFGADVLHILGVTVQGEHAFVHDCDDTSAMGLQYAASGQEVPGSAGVTHDNVVTRLDLIGGRWLVDVQTVEDLPCAA